jgi:hypothetical protein
MAVKKGVSISRNLCQLWLASDYSDKQRLQYLIYPEGIWYNKQFNEFRTPRINSIFSAIAFVARVSAENKKGQSSTIDLNSRWLELAGIEC